MKSLIHRGVQDRKLCLRSRSREEHIPALTHLCILPKDVGKQLQVQTIPTSPALDTLKDTLLTSETHKPCHKYYTAEDTRFVLGARATNILLRKQGYYYTLSKHLSCLGYAKH